MSIKYVYLLSVTVLHSVKQVNHKTFFYENVTYNVLFILS